MSDFFCHPHNVVDASRIDAERPWGIRVTAPSTDPFNKLVGGDWSREHWFIDAASRDAASGSTAHLEIRIGSSVVMLADENPDWGNLSPETIGGTPVRLHLYVEDVDACAERAVAAGAELSMPVADQFYGDRSGRILDPFGHIWILATHIEEVSQEEMQRRYDEMTSQGD